MSTPPKVWLQGIGRTFVTDGGRTVNALEGVDLRILEGEFVALIGPTGCGKTTLLNIIAGLDQPTDGQVSLAPDLVRGRNMPCVFQHYTLFPWRTVLRNVAFGLQMQSVRHRERQHAARELLASVGLDKFEHAFPHELSGGMRQRAAIAQALAVAPRLLMMDEPFGALDDATRSALQQMLIRLWQERTLTVLFVTHNIDEAVMLAERVVIFSDRPGRPIADMKLDLPRPRDPSSRAFVDAFMEIRRVLRDG